MRGRKPKPVQRAFAEGDTRKIGARKLAARLEALPKGTRGLPEPPAHLRGVEAEQWQIWRQDLELMGADYRADAAILEGACVNYARALAADQTLRREGTTIDEPVQDRVTGAVIATRTKKHPAVEISNVCWGMVRSFCSELGLTLVARQRLATGDTAPPPTDELEDILNSPRTDGSVQ